MRKLVLLLAATSLSACASGGVTKLDGPSIATRPTVTAGSQEGFVSPQVQRESGTENVIGARASSLLARFGSPRIDLSEGDSRKLQFAGSSCVLDIYLYPLASGTEPVATHIEARKRQGGEAVSKTNCIAEVERR